MPASKYCTYIFKVTYLMFQLDVPIKMFTSVVVGAEDVILPTGYKTMGDSLAYDETWDEEAGLLISDLNSDGESDIFEDCE